MKVTLRDIIWIVILIALAIFYFTSNKNTNKLINQLQNENDSLKIENVVLETKISKSEEKVLNLQDSLTLSNNELQAKEVELEKTIIYYENLRNDILNLDINDKVRYMSRRLNGE